MNPFWRSYFSDGLVQPPTSTVFPWVSQESILDGLGSTWLQRGNLHPFALCPWAFAHRQCRGFQVDESIGVVWICRSLSCEFQVFFLGFRSFRWLFTLPKFNMDPEKLPSLNRKVVFQPPFFRGYVQLWGVVLFTKVNLNYHSTTLGKSKLKTTSFWVFFFSAWIYLPESYLVRIGVNELLSL